MTAFPEANSPKENIRYSYCMIFISILNLIYNVGSLKCELIST